MSAVPSCGKDEGPHACESCERRSLLRHLDSWGRCPACRRSRPPLGIGRIFWMILLIVAVSLATGPWVKLAALLAVWPLWLLSTVMHEATHALAAVLLGWRVHTITIGTGEPWSELRLGGTRVVLTRFLLAGGSCFALPARGGPSSGAIALFTAAPIVVHAAVVAAALPWVSPSIGGVLAALFVMSNLFDAVWNAWPGHPDSDGKRLWNLLWAPRAELEVWRLHVALGPVHAHLLEGRPDAAFRAAERVAAEAPGNEAAGYAFAVAAHVTGRAELALPHVAAYAKGIEILRPRELQGLPDRDLAARGLFRAQELETYMRGSLLVATDRLDEALAISERGVAAATSEEARALWQGCVALALLMMGRDLDRAEEAARWAYGRLPWVPFVETAWGMVRIERGDPAQGLAVFDRVAAIDPGGKTAGLRAAWAAAARAAAGKRVFEIPDELRLPNAWPACRRRAERALSGGC